MSIAFFAQYPTPAVHPWSAAGTETPILIFLAATGTATGEDACVGTSAVAVTVAIIRPGQHGKLRNSHWTSINSTIDQLSPKPRPHYRRPR